MDSNIVGHAMMIYRASTDCPIGCLSGLLFLKARGTDRLFLHCIDCQVAWADLPTEERNPKWTEWHQLAPKGIALPSREEIEKAGWGNAIDGEFLSEEYEWTIWELWTRTAIEAGDYERAIGIADQVIAPDRGKGLEDRHSWSCVCRSAGRVPIRRERWAPAAFP
jgi:hypothetical protein